MNVAALGIAAVDAALDRLPALRTMRRDHAEPLTGSANRVFRLRLDGRDYVMRFPGRARYIDVRAEFANQRRAAEAGVAPFPVALDESSGAIVSRWLAGDTVAAPGKTDGTALAHCLARLHHTTEPFDDVIGPRNALRWNLVAPAIGDARVAGLVAHVDALLDTLPPADPVNCHGDPTAGNVIGGSDSLPAVQLVDWEYSHRNRAAWDLAIHCNEADREEADEARWLAVYGRAAHGYGGRVVDGTELAVMRAVTALATAAWLINHGGDPAAVDETIETARRQLGAARQG